MPSIQGTDTSHGFERYLKRMGARAGGRAIEGLEQDTETRPDVGLAKTKWYRK